MERAEKIQFKGVFLHRDEAARALSSPGDAALVKREIPRLLLLRCPCRCGDDLIINLDPRVGPSWRYYQRGNSITLYPSYWRDSKCESHFILWRNHVHWCDWDDDRFWSDSNDTEAKVLEALPRTFVNYIELAEDLELIPWDVLQACHALVRKGRAISNNAARKGEFRKNVPN